MQAPDRKRNANCESRTVAERCLVLMLVCQRNGADFSVYIVGCCDRDHLFKLTVIRILGRSLMVRIRVLDLTKRCPGARFERVPNL